jgi:hypothetical protein
VTHYLVPDHVRVRQEDFGLLFYDTRSTRLTFVRSGDRLVPPPFTGERRTLMVVANAAPFAVDPEAASAHAGEPHRRETDAALSRVLAELVERGLLFALPDE